MTEEAIEGFSDDQLVDEILVDMGLFIHHLKASAAGICAQLPVEVAEGGFHYLSYAQYRVIIYLAKSGQSPVGEIANGIGVTIATASQLIDKLVDEGWLARGTNPDDRRQVLIQMTERSEEVAARIQAIRRAQVRKALESLSTEDAAAAPRVFRAFVAALASVQTSGDAKKVGEMLMTEFGGISS